MLNQLINRVARRAGRNYRVDESVPSLFLLREVLSRARDILRGLFRFRTTAFLGPKVTLKYKRGIHLGLYATIGANSVIDGSGTMGVVLADGSKIGRNTVVTTTSQLGKRGVGFRMGRNSAIGDYSHVGCSGGVLVGDDVIMGPYTTFHSQEHIADSVDVPIRLQGTRESKVSLGNDIWVGARCSFLAGSKVGDHSIIAAGSVVRGEFPPRSVIGGVPARILKPRLSDTDSE